MNIKRVVTLGLALTLSAVTFVSHGEVTELASSPLVTSSSTSVLPNIMFILDDSGSMDWDYMPDWANDNGYASRPEFFANAGFNGLAYDPATTYAPPTTYKADGTLDTTTHPSNTSAVTSGWTLVKNDGYGVQSTGKTNLVTRGAYYYTFIPGEYCTSPSLRSCVIASSPTASHPYPASLRWCSSSSMTSCQAAWIKNSYEYPRDAGRSASTSMTVGSSGSTSVTSIKINGKEILSGDTSSDNDREDVAERIKDKINDCTATITGSCQIAGYRATRSNRTVTIYAPTGTGAISYEPVVTKSGGMSISTEEFSGGLPGSNLRVDLVSGTNSYSYPGTATKASTRTDCAAATCTYAEEMTNYANWWSYYRTRMQMMKTATSNAFSSIGSNYRVGYSSLNNNTGSDFLNISAFNTSQKVNWYAELFAARPNSGTPLREALAKVGRLYAGQLNTFNGVGVTDPVQYSCQQNFAILSTDGYWNGNQGYKLDGSTSIGDQDASEPRPFNDGGTVTYQKTTSQLQETQTQKLKTTNQLLKRVEQIKKRTVLTEKRTLAPLKVTAQLYRRTSNNSGNSWTDWSSVSSCQEDSSSSSRTQCEVGTLESRTYSFWNGWGDWEPAGSCSASTGWNARECRITQNWVAAASCTPSRTGSSGSYSWTGGASAVNCSTGWSEWAAAATCIASATVECRTTDSGWVNASSCNADSSGGQTITCQTTDTGFISASTCEPGASGGQTTTCNAAVTGPTLVASCSSETANAGNNWTQTTCTANTISPATGVGSCTAVSPVAPDFISTTCNTVTSTTTVSNCTEAAASAGNDWTQTTCGAPVASGGISNTLADVASYYYRTDLRTSALGNCTSPIGETLCSNVSPDPYNNVPTSGSDGAATQHMTTFTLGLGASGYMQYSSSYQSATSGDFFDVKNGTSANPTGGVCTWQASGACNWPVPSADSQANIDDLWHAAVNGRGAYFSATNPASLSASLQSALAGVSARTGASAAATTSNPNITSGDNFVFSSTFTTQNWDGELVRQQLNLTTGETLSAIDWAAQAQLDAKSFAERDIYTYSASGTNKMQVFDYSEMDSTAKSYFESTHIAAQPLSQFCTSGVTCLSSADQTEAVGEKLVNFLRGDRSNEGASTDISKYYRQRSHILGDIVNAEAVYVKGSLFNYGDYRYKDDFVVDIANRQGMVYVAANDGMLHAFYAEDGAGVTGGEEAWAYIPSFVLPELYKLADKNYANQHQYYVDGTPVVGDVCVSDCSDQNLAAWKTILVGGLNGGGRGYYALDITVPSSPKVMWEFTHTNMGYTYGNPKITKLKNGTWVVLLASGYNNVSPGDGRGHLFVINAATGNLETSINSTGIISTSEGSTGTISGVCAAAPCPSGLSKIAAQVLNPATNNTVVAVYGGDLYGNLWRFDVNGDIGAAGHDAQLLASLRGPTGNIQPITTKPEVGLVGGATVVFVGTGKYLGGSDASSSTVKQTIYGIKDPLSVGTTPNTAIFANPRTISTFVGQEQTQGTCPANAPASLCAAGEIVKQVASPRAVNFATDTGWYLDLGEGERANTDPTLALATLGFTTNVPESSACTVGGFSFRYFLDYRTGAPVSTSTGNIIGSKLGNALATRPVYVRLPNNTVVELTRTSDGVTITSNVPIGSGASTTRRTSWRELITE